MKRIIQAIVILAAIAGSLIVAGPQLAAASPPLQPAPRAPMALLAVSASVKREVISSLKIGWPWYVTRAAGLVAAVLLILLMLSGIGQITGLTYRVVEPLTAWRLHRALGIAFGATVVIHALPLLVDTFVHFNILQILLPFASPYMPMTIAGVHVGSLGVALGVFSTYVTAAVLLSSFFWIDKKPSAWRFLHYLSHLLVVMVFLHGLLVGTDLKKGWLRWMWLLAGFLIALGILSRLRRARATSQHKDEAR